MRKKYSTKLILALIFVSVCSCAVIPMPDVSVTVRTIEDRGYNECQVSFESLSDRECRFDIHLDWEL